MNIVLSVDPTPNGALAIFFSGLDFRSQSFLLQAMATPSFLVSRINSLLHTVAGSYSPELIICLRNLKVLLLCLGNLGDDHVHEMRSLFSRIESATLSRPTEGINGLAEEVNQIWYTKGITMPNRLTLDDAVEVADSVLQTAAAISPELAAAPLNVGAMEEFKAQTGFLRDFLLFAKRSGGVETQQLQDLLIHVTPFVMDAARLFQVHEESLVFAYGQLRWVKAVESKYPSLDPQVFHAYIQTLSSIPMTTLERNDADADVVLKDFIGSLISLVWHLLRYGRHPHHLDSLRALYEALRLSRSYLKRRRGSGDFEVQIGVLIRDAGIAICSLYLKDVHLPSFSILLSRFDVVQPQAPPESLKAKALHFGDSTGIEDVSGGIVHSETSMPHHQSSSTPGEVGFQEDEVASILDRLQRGSKQLRLVPITGMAGLGKTTFALKVYNQRSVMYHFQARAWCTISQVLDKKKVFVHLLDQIQPGDYKEMTEDDLANMLRKSLKGKRYLILLDDVWNPQVWESLRPSLPDDGTGSRILLTSRLHNIVPCAWLDEQPHSLRLRKENECLEIIEVKLLDKAKGFREELAKFANLCKGLPLTSVIVAGLLATTVQEGWDDIFDHLSSGGISGIEQCKIALELSYKNLPRDLKCCFMYFGAFPEDEWIYIERLIRLWMAEGFVDKKDNLSKKRIEDVAREYLDNLIQRNLVMVDEKSSLGGVKTCRIHDLLHDFCLIKGKEENLFHLLRQRDDELSEFNEPYNLKRISIHSESLHFWESRLFCPLAHSILFFKNMTENVETPLFDMSFIIHIYKGLKVLNMHQLWFARGIPESIVLLTHLTYLSVSPYTGVIPSFIGNLSNLETLIITFYRTEPVTLPHTLWDLRKLRYLHITSVISFHCFHFPTKYLDKCPNLLDLETIRGVKFYPDGRMEKQMSKFPNIRTLKCKILFNRKSFERSNLSFVVPEFLSQLERLNLYTNHPLQCHKFDFLASKSLKKVTLVEFLLSREEIAVIGKLPNLEVLKLIGVSFSGDRMEMEYGEFSKLRILSLSRTYYLKTWTATGDEQLPCLEKLLFYGCTDLKEIPDSCLENSSTLEEIEVSSSSLTLESIVRDIEEVQKDCGNLIKVKFDSNRDKTEWEEEEDDDDDEEE